MPEKVRFITTAVRGFGRVWAEAAPARGDKVAATANASKRALEALHDSLAQELAGFGIKATLLAPGAVATGFAGPAPLKIAA